MRLIIIRHGDPDYVHDCLTEKGKKEAALLAERMAKEKIDAVYVSPLGRAKETASWTLKKTGMEAEELEWLKEFDPRISRPDRTDRKTRVWDWLPQDWTENGQFYDLQSWYDHPVMREGNVREEYLKICTEFDRLLEKHGYRHSGHMFDAVSSNHDTVVLFCHFGVQMVLLSHLLEVSPMILWHGFCAAPSSVTILNTEERRQGKAVFRIASFGDTSHLYAGNEEISFAARYCECYEDPSLH